MYALSVSMERVCVCMGVFAHTCPGVILLTCMLLLPSFFTWDPSFQILDNTGADPSLVERAGTEEKPENH